MLQLLGETIAYYKQLSTEQTSDQLVPPRVKPESELHVHTKVVHEHSQQPKSGHSPDLHELIRGNRGQLHGGILTCNEKEGRSDVCTVTDGV